MIRPAATTASAPPTGPGSTERPAFDLCGPLPTGTTVLEASAGTGKTYAIAALVARFVAEGQARLDQMLMVTFSRMATNELRSRIRERLVEVEIALATSLAALAGPAGSPTAPGPVPDPVVTLLTSGDPTRLVQRHIRIVAALADFDAATIATTHEFCLRMLAGLGVLGEGEPDAVYVEDVHDLVREVTADCYLQAFATEPRPPLSFTDALTLAKEVIGAPHARLVPDDTQGRAQIRYDFAIAVRQQVEHRKLAQRLVSYDDMLTRLRDSLTDRGHGPAAARRLSDRYRIVLVDEFQDTDPIQWEIVRTAFVGHSTVVLIGDPKQAIYAFRGADVFSYLEAVAESGQVSTLDTNYRSDVDLVTGLDLLFQQAQLGEGIQVRPVGASHRERRLTNPGRPELAAPIRIRYRPDDADAPDPQYVSTLRGPVVADLVADVADQLSAGTRISPDGEPTRPVRPSDIAVLVSRNSYGEEIRHALTHAGVPAVMTGASSVFATAVADDWATLLGALDPSNLAGARRVAMTRFVGWTLPQLAQADEDALTELTVQVRLWARILTRHGVAALLEDVGARTDLTARLLRHAGGERELTDLRHIGQALHAAALHGQLGLPGMVEWLSARRTEAVGANDDDRSRRLETDARAVQIMTVWKAKGLQFPIVYLPEAWDRWVPDDDQSRANTLHVPDPSGRLECVLDVGGSGVPGRSARWTRHRQEDDAESLRLLYVGLTRAECQAVTWWQPSSRNTASSPLHRLLFNAEPGGMLAAAYEGTGDPSTLSRLDPRYFSLEPQQPGGRTAPSPAAPEHGPRPLAARPFLRPLDLDWRRTSYSSLTAAVGHGPGAGPGGVTSESEPVREDDEATGVGDLSAPALATATADASVAQHAAAGLDRESPMAALPGGTDFGSLVHAVAEEVDPTATDLRAELTAAATRQMARMPAPSFTPAQLVDGLLPAYATPLGPLAAERTLAEFGVRDRLAELDFELPLAGGDARLAPAASAVAGRVPQLGDLVPLLRQHLDAADPLGGYADDLTEPQLAEQSLQGYLTGSIDAVLRVDHRTGDPDRQTYLVVDYKTNRLGSPERRAVLGDYTPAVMATAMRSSHYPLQALLYAVALHRYLRWRLPGYRPDQHLGGVLYLFVRGMAGPDTPRVGPAPCGVFSWRPPTGLVTDLSDLLDRGPR